MANICACRASVFCIKFKTFGAKGRWSLSASQDASRRRVTHNLTDAMLTGVLFTSPNNGYIIGGEKTLLKYTAITGEEEQGGVEAGKQGGLEVFPNPGWGIYNLQFTNYNLQSSKVEIVNLYGKPVNISPLHRLGEGPGVGTETLELDISHLPAGVYFVWINIDAKLIVKKLIKL